MKRQRPSVRVYPTPGAPTPDHHPHLAAALAIAALAVPTAHAQPADTHTPPANAPALAHDRGSIAFMRPGQVGGYDLWAVHPDGGGLRRLTTAPAGQLDYNPDWSPDGSRVLFERRADAGDDLYTVRGDGTGLRRLTDCTGDCWSFDEGTWSADGRSIAAGLASGPHAIGHPSKVAIAVGNADGRAFRELSTPELGEEDHYPTWAPDGRTIVFMRNFANDPLTPTALMAVDVRSGAERVVYKFPSWAPGGGIPKYSPDGRRIMFTYWCAIAPGDECPAESRSPRNDTIATIRPDGTGLRILPLRELGDSGSWAPSGRRLVCRCQIAPFVFRVCTSRLNGRDLRAFPWEVFSAHPDWGTRRP